MAPTQLKVSLTIATAAFLTACGAQGTPSIANGRPVPSPGSHAPRISEQSVAYQINVEHTGFVQRPLHRPLTQLWSVDLGGSRGSVGYPVVANGIVVVASNDQLVALDEKTGIVLWKQGSPSGYWVGPAYDNGMIFSNPSEGSGSSNVGMYAFDERTGKQLWSAPAPGQVFFSSPPTAVSGVVYTAAAGVGGTVYAYDESTGALKWTASVMNGDDSSPVVTSSGVYVSYACPQTYDFKPSNGKQIWHFSGPCEGGGGSTPALYDGLLFVGDSQALSGYNGLILKAKNGKIAGGFNAYFTPAFAYQRGFFVSGSTLEAQDIPQMQQAWLVNLGSSDSYATPPLVVGNIAYIETAAGNLVGYDVENGKEKVQMKLGNGGYYRGLFAGLAYGDNELIVPNGAYLIALKGR